MNPNLASVRWRKSTHSGSNGGSCVQVANALCALRDSKNATGPVLSVPVSAFLRAVKTGQFG